MRQIANMSLMERLKMVMGMGKAGALSPGGMLPKTKIGTGHRKTPKERADERKRMEKNKLAKVLERVAAPLKKADLLTLAQHTIANLSYHQVPALAKCHNVETAKTSKLPEEMVMKKVGTYDEAALSRLLLEISLLDSAYQ